MNSLSYIRTVVTGLIDAMGGDSYEQRLNKDMWMLICGSVTVGIMLLENKENLDESRLLVTARIMKMPLLKALPFYRKLLELNYEMVGTCAFAMNDENIVVLRSGRSVKDIDASELIDIVKNVALLANHYGELLLDEFGRENKL